LSDDDRLRVILGEEPEWPPVDFAGFIQRARRARTARIAFFATVVLLAAAGVGVAAVRLRGPVKSVTVQPPHPAATVYSNACVSTQLMLAPHEGVSEATGQHTAVFVVTNSSDAGCYLDGYPKVRLLDGARRVLPFSYRDHGDQMLTSARPRRVQLPPGGHAFFAVNKYRCDLGDKGTAATIEVTPPGDSTSVSVTLARGSGAETLSYCGAGDSGSLIDLSPIVATPDAVLSVSGQTPASPTPSHVPKETRPSPSSSLTTVVATDSDNGGTIVLRPGQKLKVVLSSTYWQFQDSSDRAVLRLDGQPQYAPRSTDPSGASCVPGQGCGTATAIFRAISAGQATVTATRNACGEALRCTGSQGSYMLNVIVRS